MYDIIGDIHGHADKLEELLIKLDYAKKNGVYAHPTRKAFFLGDFIDRGPKIKETLQIVRSMIEAGNAKSVMANHEFNMICFMNKDLTSGEYLRERSIKNIKQVSETLSQLTTEELEDYTRWFETLPLWYEDEHFRAVHACWDQQSINFLKECTHNECVSLQTIRQNYDKGSDFYNAIEVVLKGPEQKLAHGKTFLDKDKNVRSEVRVAWWNKETLVAGSDEIKKQVSESDVQYPFYPKNEKLAFFGHYWLPYKEAVITAPNAQCLDFSVARDGVLMAYRHDGESEVELGKFVWV